MSHYHRLKANRARIGQSQPTESAQLVAEHIGGSWYLLPGGRKVQGKAKRDEELDAMAKLRELSPPL